MIKRLLSLFAIAAIAVITIPACEDKPQPDPTVPLQGITVAPATHTLEIGGTVKLTVTYNPENATVKPEVEWSTSNARVATVDNGTVVAVAEGTAEITATADKFTAKCVITVNPADPGPGPEPQDNWDYTPSAAYSAEANIWKGVDADHTLAWYYNPKWAGEKDAPEVTFKESTYKLTIPDDTDAAWQAQLWITPKTDLILDDTHYYTFSCTVASTAQSPIYFKMYQNGVNWPFSFETPAEQRLTVGPDANLSVLVEKFLPLTTPQSLLIDFGGAPAGTTFYIKDIVLIVDGDVPAPQPDTWDYTPGENYLAESNLWKPVFDANLEYVWGNITAWVATVADEAAGLTKNESTYKFHFNGATEGEWSNCNFIAPDADHKVALSAGKNYMMEYVIGATKDLPRAFIKINKDNPELANREGGYVIDRADVLVANTPLVVSYEFEGVDCDNISLTIDFGGNPEQVDIYIKDLTIREVVKDVPDPGSEIPDFDPITGFEW
ncbi:MAG: Ig domain-containing protein [Bacteroidales bacterium]|nr:Ig domain-containing protein [Bacteroidales bacterium]